MAQEKKSLVDEVLDDALQVRDTALANAKLALQEAFEPRIKSMVSRHLQSEAELEEAELEERGDEDMDEMEDEELEERGEEEVDEGEEIGLPDPTNADDASLEEGEHEDEVEEELEPSDIDDENEEPSDVASDDSGIGEGDYSDEEMEEEMEDEDDLDLESVIAELEAELSEEEDEDYMDEEEDEIDMDDMSMDSEEEEEDDDEIIDLDELLSALTEEDEEEVEEVVEEQSELEQENQRLASELKEHREAVEILRTKLNEVNLLNAKLLYTTKLFRKFNLSNDQKMKVVESFDRTSSVRETKLVFSTLAESLSMNNSSKTKKKVASITEGFASKPTTSTKPKQQEIISEGNEVADRFRRLVSYNK